MNNNHNNNNSNTNTYHRHIKFKTNENHNQLNQCLNHQNELQNIILEAMPLLDFGDKTIQNQNLLMDKYWGEITKIVQQNEFGLGNRLGRNPDQNDDQFDPDKRKRYACFETMDVKTPCPKTSNIHGINSAIASGGGGSGSGGSAITISIGPERKLSHDAKFLSFNDEIQLEEIGAKISLKDQNNNNNTSNNSMIITKTALNEFLKSDNDSSQTDTTDPLNKTKDDNIKGGYIKYEIRRKSCHCNDCGGMSKKERDTLCMPVYLPIYSSQKKCNLNTIAQAAKILVLPIKQRVQKIHKYSQSTNHPNKNHLKDNLNHSKSINTLTRGLPISSTHLSQASTLLLLSDATSRQQPRKSFEIINNNSKKSDFLQLTKQLPLSKYEMYEPKTGRDTLIDRDEKKSMMNISQMMTKSSYFSQNIDNYCIISNFANIQEALSERNSLYTGNISAIRNNSSTIIKGSNNDDMNFMKSSCNNNNNSSALKDIIMNQNEENHSSQGSFSYILSHNNTKTNLNYKQLITTPPIKSTSSIMETSIKIGDMYNPREFSTALKNKNNNNQSKIDAIGSKMIAKSLKKSIDLDNVIPIKSYSFNNVASAPQRKFIKKKKPNSMTNSQLMNLNSSTNLANHSLGNISFGPNHNIIYPRSRNKSSEDIIKNIILPKIGEINEIYHPKSMKSSINKGTSTANNNSKRSQKSKFYESAIHPQRNLNFDNGPYSIRVIKANERKKQISGILYIIPPNIMFSNDSN